MAIHLLRALDVKTLGDGMHRDGGGLFLRVRGKSRTWAFRYTFNGRQMPPLSLGSIAKVDLALARDKARECNRLIDVEGKDPADVKRSEGLSEEIKAGLAMKMTKMVDHYMDVHISQLRSEHARKAGARYCKIIIKTIGEVPVRLVTTHMIIERFGLIELCKTKPPTAKQIYTHLDVIFRLARAPCGLKENPADWDALKPWLGKIMEKHKPVPRAALNYKEVARFLDKVRSYRNPGNTERLTSSYWLEFVMLSGVRISEARLATWDEIVGDNWHVPPEHRKNGHLTDKVRTIPITKSMKKVLNDMRSRRSSSSNLIFPAPHGGAYDVQSMGRFIRDSLKWETTVTAHGFRNTLTDWAEANDENMLLIERQFDHLPPGQVRQAYSSVTRKQSEDPTLELRRAMMEKWDAYCNRLEPLPAKVVNFRKAK
jgi:integrase